MTGGVNVFSMEHFQKFINFIEDRNVEEATILMENYLAKVRRYEQELREMSSKLTSVIDEAVYYSIKYRPPVEIKRDIKHEKNPMRLKQLNQELNESYKYYKRTKKK